MKAGLEVSVESKATVHVFVDGKEVKRQGKRGAKSVDVNDELLCSWTVLGDPDAEFKITFTGAAGYKVVVITGSNPTVSKLPTTRFTGGGWSRIKLVQAGAS